MMKPDNKPAIQALVAERRSLLNRIAAAEAKLDMLKRRVALAEVKLICFGHDMDKLRALRQHPKLFKGRSIIRRIADAQRVAGRNLKPKELTVILAAQDGLDPSSWFIRVSGRRRVKDAMKRSRRRHDRIIFEAMRCPTSHE